MMHVARDFETTTNMEITDLKGNLNKETVKNVEAESEIRTLKKQLALLTAENKKNRELLFEAQMKRVDTDTISTQKSLSYQQLLEENGSLLLTVQNLEDTNQKRNSEILSLNQDMVKLKIKNNDLQNQYTTLNKLFDAKDATLK